MTLQLNSVEMTYDEMSLGDTSSKWYKHLIVKGMLRNQHFDVEIFHKGHQSSSISITAIWGLLLKLNQ